MISFRVAIRSGRLSASRQVRRLGLHNCMVLIVYLDLSLFAQIHLLRRSLAVAFIQ